MALLGSANLASRRPVFEQYDSTVQVNTVVGPGRGAAVLRGKGTTKALGAATDAHAPAARGRGRPARPPGRGAGGSSTPSPPLSGRPSPPRATWCSSWARRAPGSPA